MRVTMLVAVVVMLVGTAPAFVAPPAQQEQEKLPQVDRESEGWIHFKSIEDGFSANFPGQPKVEQITYPTEYRMELPARVYRGEDALGRYSTTVVDYRGIQKLHDAAEAKCKAAAAKGASGLDGDACQNDYRVEVAGAVDYAAWNLMRQDGVKTTHYLWYHLEMVAGRFLQLTNPDQTRTIAAVHQHQGRVYIHKATVSKGMPVPILFMQSLGWVNRAGKNIRYKTFYTEGYGDWRYPAPIPPRVERDMLDLGY